MAMMVTLRTKNGADVVTDRDISDGTMTAYPEIIIYDAKSYVMKRLMPNKQSAYYYEAVSLDIAKPEGAA